MRRTQVVERMDVNLENVYFHEHLARYQFVLSQLPQGAILDVATGTGYGANLLHRSLGTFVVGVDVDRVALRTARATYQQPLLSFLNGDGTNLPFADHTFAAVVSFETIEHIEDDQRFLHELTRILALDGICFISTPNRAHSEYHHRVNPFHIREYAEHELMELLQDYFGSVTIFYQGFGQGYHSKVQQYQQDIQTRKRQLPVLVQFAINYGYRPIKSYFPVEVSNYLIQNWLKLRYPAPTPAQLTIATEPLSDTGVFLMRCTHPLYRTV